jgi:hypothetical protein
LGTGAKVAIGCGIAALVGMVAVAVALFGGIWWVKGKTEQFAVTETRIEELKKQANGVPFVEPSDGVVREDRLVKFLDVRRRVFDVYSRHRDELEAIDKKKKADLGDLRRGLGAFNEARLAQAQALADVGMSENEYRFMVEQVYKTLPASEGAKPADIPPANIALFRKYEADIKQYAMGGLEWIGL